MACSPLQVQAGQRAGVGAKVEVEEAGVELAVAVMALVEAAQWRQTQQTQQVHMQLLQEKRRGQRREWRARSAFAMH